MFNGKHKNRKRFHNRLFYTEVSCVLIGLISPKNREAYPADFVSFNERLKINSIKVLEGLKDNSQPVHRLVYGIT